MAESKKKVAFSVSGYFEIGDQVSLADATECVRDIRETATGVGKVERSVLLINGEEFEVR